MVLPLINDISRAHGRECRNDHRSEQPAFSTEPAEPGPAALVGRSSEESRSDLAILPRRGARDGDDVVDELPQTIMSPITLPVDQVSGLHVAEFKWNVDFLKAYGSEDPTLVGNAGLSLDPAAIHRGVGP